MKILNFGSLNVDRVYQVGDFVRAGETILATDLKFFPGGKGLNQTIGCAKAGGNIYHVGNIGEDGQILKECLLENHVPLDYIRELPGDGGHTALQVNENGQNAIIVFSGTNHRMDKDFVDQIMKNVEPGDMILMQNEINNVPYVMEAAKSAGAFIVLNPSPITPELTSYPLHLVDLFILNEIEGNCLTGETEPDAILEKFASLYPEAQIVLTLGGDGSCYSFRGESIKQSIYRSNVVDTTAAGDTYCGYLLTSLSQGKTAAEALKIASAASSIAVSRAGAAVSIPTMDEVIPFMEQYDQEHKSEQEQE